VQTGEYGANVGQVTLTVDRETGDVQSYTVRNVARTSRTDSDLVAAYPRVAEVKQIVDKALSDAAAVGNQPVGHISGDITRAFSTGAYDGGVYTDPLPRTEDRSAESTMGDLVGNALRDGLPEDMGTPDLGLVNPGGVREDLFYAGNTANNPANTDGVVTYAEANAVLPFVNNVSLVDLTGAELVQVLEEQWQRPAPGGPAPSRPYLQVGLSDNVEVTADASRPQDSRITSVRIYGEPIDPAATYTVSTFSFLASGGDNFHTFKDGVASDTGLVDRDLWISYLQRTMEEGAAPIAPDFARQQVFETGKPASAQARQHYEFTLGPDLVSPTTPVTGEKLDLTSLGSPANTSVTMTAVAPDGGRTDLGSVPVTNGTASVAFTVPAGLGDGARVVLQAQPSGTTVTIPVTPAPPPVETETTASADPMVYGTPGQVDVTVSSTVPVTGDVELRDGNDVVATGTLDEHGTATLAVPGTAFPAGSHELTVHYLGDDANEPSQDGVTLSVSKAASTTFATASPAQVKVKKGTVAVEAEVSATGFQPTGEVQVFDEGGNPLGGPVPLTDGRATLTVGPFTTVGIQNLTVRYLGDERGVEESTDTVSVEVVKRNPTTTVDRTTRQIVARETRAVLTVAVDAGADVVPTGRVEVRLSGEVLQAGRLDGGSVRLRLPVFSRAGEKTVRVAYLGNSEVQADAVPYTFTVRGS
jgi:5'-nucleotidase